MQIIRQSQQFSMTIQQQKPSSPSGVSASGGRTAMCVNMVIKGPHGQFLRGC